MRTDTNSCNYPDARNLLEKLQEQVKELERKLAEQKAKLHVVQKVLRENDGGSQSWLVNLPHFVLPERRAHKSKRGINWKERVLAMFRRYNTPMTTDLLYHKLVLHYADIPFDRRVAVRSISAALSRLEEREKMLKRTPLKGQKGYVYGLEDCFDVEGTLTPYFMEQYLREAGMEAGETRGGKHRQPERKTSRTKLPY